MSLLSRLLHAAASTPDGPVDGITSTARQPDWYLRHGVEDTVDGRFDMVALVTSLVMFRLERSDLKVETALLTERFVEDMDGSLQGHRDRRHGDRQACRPDGDGALGGRLGAYRKALAGDAPEGDTGRSACPQRLSW
jgi:cytochrome b pre-mRNA-processing protein 3